MIKTGLIIAALGISAGVLTIVTHHADKKNVITNDKPGFVIMELFTSQGCSSCPAADDLLGEYSLKNDSRIIPVAFHVDYWNQLGWKDSLSDHRYTLRQAYYDENILHTSEYTPQLIINGEKEMVGSDRPAIEKAVGNALNETSSVNIEITKQAIMGNQLELNYSIRGIAARSTVYALLIQNKTVTNIKAGENRGVTLANYNIVRDMVYSPVKDSGTSFIHLPAGINEKDLSLVLFVQENLSGKITGALKKNL
jgi:hypothetical protein